MLATFTVVAGDVDPLQALCDEGWRRSMENWHEKTGLVYGCAPAKVRSSKGCENHMFPYSKERGYGAGMGDCALICGTALSGLVDRFEVLRDDETRRDAAKVARGVLNLAKLHGVKGFVARGLCADDARTICSLSSRDQFTHWVHGLWRYVNSPMADPALVEEYRVLVADVARFMEARVTAERDWNFGLADGGMDPRGICTMWGPKLQPHEQARLPMIYLAAYLATSDAHWRDLYENCIDEALDKTLPIAGKNRNKIACSMPCYSLYQANVSLELIYSYETNAVRRTKIFDSMRGFAQVAADRAKICLKRPEKTYYGMCWDGELALTQLLVPGSPSMDCLCPFLERTICRSDPSRWGVCRAAHLMAAYWRARRAEYMCASAPVECDLVVYGSSPAALTAAIEAQRLGRTAVIVCPEIRIGGLTTGGLGQTDIGNKSAFGGLALRFYRDVADWYKDPAHWKYEKRSEYIPDGQCAGSFGEDSMWTFEPSAALAILERWERENKLKIFRGEFLDRSPGGVIRESSRIVGFRTLSGRTFRGRMFVDATYEGDLMAAAGVDYVVGREANSVYGETISGVARALSKNHQFNKGVSPYVKPDDPSSGLLPYVEPDTEEPDGSGDGRVQAYCFRMCLTDNPSNSIPFVKPAGYDPLNYELLLRNLEAIDPKAFGGKSGQSCPFVPWINSRMPNRKTDTNNSMGFSTDFIGQNHAWPEASYEERAKILKAHLDYQMGLMWTLANNPRVPEPIRNCVAQWGTCRDEFADGPGFGWQSQLYVREARRMVGDYVATEQDVLRKRTASRPVAMAAYGMDSHHVRRYVGKDGFVHNEGNIEDWRAGGRPYPIDYGVIVPKKTDCENLFVPVCVSASHMAFGSIRMEPVFFALGQVAGAAASLSIEEGCAVQDLPYEPLKKVLLDGGQVIGRSRGEGSR